LHETSIARQTSIQLKINKLITTNKLTLSAALLHLRTSTVSYKLAAKNNVSKALFKLSAASTRSLAKVTLSLAHIKLGFLQTRAVYRTALKLASLNMSTLKITVSGLVAKVIRQFMTMMGVGN
jgi:hypothetical protein